jgi:regulator of protease activity HflC (stomatin/prohibitin superfamily)
MSEQKRSTSVVEPVGHQGARVEIQQRQAAMITGWLGVAALFGLAGATYAAIVTQAGGWAIALPIIAFVLVASSLVTVPPGQSRVVQFFGTYVGTVRRPGLWCVWPLATRRTVSIRVRNFETNRLKVNDADGNPIEIAAIVVWQVADTAKAVYGVDDYPAFVSIQAEAALRHVATGHPYEPHEDTQGGGTSLRGSTDAVADQLATEVAERVAIAGVRVVEVRISHLAYAAEIAQAMLRRQQANAVVAARSRIVEGAVGMVELALSRLTEKGVVELDEERTAAMVSNLMVVLCGDQPPTPVVNAGTLYS